MPEIPAPLVEPVTPLVRPVEIRGVRVERATSLVELVETP